MSKELLMGNQAIALGAIKAGVGCVSGYPGTPSTEILETIAEKNPGDIYVEWSVNEKVALEVAAGSAMAGTRSLVTMKQVGLNVAADPVMSLSYIGVKGGMVVVVADDPGPISSQTEQDTRLFAMFSKIPVFDPSSPEEAFNMIQDAFEYSEKYQTPVLFRPTTRVCHGCGVVETDIERKEITKGNFEKDSKWVIFPRTSYLNHIKLEHRRPILAKDFSEYRYNTIEGNGKIGIATSGISYAYTCEAIKLLGIEKEVKVMKIATAYPFPEDLTLEFLKDINTVIVIEELEPVIERELIYICGKNHLKTDILGKETGNMQVAGENTVESVKKAIRVVLGIQSEEQPIELPALPVRPPVLCAGCPHRASFYAVKKAMKGRKAVFSGDIGCYTLGNAKPLNMVDTCLCMGAGVTMAQGLHRVENDSVNFAFIGDGTFFHTGIPGVINAVYNGTDIVLIILDNSTTAMTGHQPHPGTGKTMMKEITEVIKIENVLKGIGVTHVVTKDPLKLEEAIEAIKEAADVKGVSAIIFKSPCIAVSKPSKAYIVNEDKCTGCKKCIREIGCPAIVKSGDKVTVDEGLCYGCGLCSYVCSFGAFER